VTETYCSYRFTSNLKGDTCLVQLSDRKIERSIVWEKRPVQFDKYSRIHLPHLPFHIGTNVLPESGPLNGSILTYPSLKRAYPGPHNIRRRNYDVGSLNCRSVNVSIELLSDHGSRYKARTSIQALARATSLTSSAAKARLRKTIWRARARHVSQGMPASESARAVAATTPCRSAVDANRS